jgi:HK97 family phage prohead protease
MKLDYKFCKFADLETDFEKGQFEGYASTYGNVDLVGDVIQPGAFAKSCEQKPKTKLLFQHLLSEVLGIGEVRSDSNGLYIKGFLNLEVRKAREVHSLMKQGALDAMSVGFQVPDKENNIEYTASGERLIKECDLMEVSIVSFPADPRALIQSVKSLDVKSIKSIREAEEALRDLGLSIKQSQHLISVIKRFDANPEEVDAELVLSKFYQSLNHKLTK